MCPCFREGTTDTTRTIHLGTPSKHEQVNVHLFLHCSLEFRYLNLLMYVVDHWFNLILHVRNRSVSHGFSKVTLTLPLLYSHLVLKVLTFVFRSLSYNLFHGFYFK